MVRLMGRSGRVLWIRQAVPVALLGGLLFLALRSALSARLERAMSRRRISLARLRRESLSGRVMSPAAVSRRRRSANTL